MTRQYETVTPGVFVGKSSFDGSKIFKNGLPIFVNRAIKQRPPDLQIHTHDFIEISYIYAGTGMHQILNESTPVSKGDLYLINPNVPHRFLSDDKLADDEFVVFNYDFSAELFSEASIQISKNIPMDELFLYSSIFKKDNPVPYYHVHLTGSDVKDIEELYERAYMEMQTHKLGYENVLFSYLMVFLVFFYRRLIPKDNASSGSYKKAMIEDALHYIDEHFADPDLSLELLADRYFINKSYFSILFKDIVGLKFSKHLQNRRISYACDLLTQTNLHIMEIMFRSGYHDVKYFTELFKAITGQTPSQYRRKAT